MPSCNPDDLMAAANEIYSKIPAGRQLAVQTYLMAVRAGVTTNPDELAELAKQFNFGDQQSLQVQSYLLCQIANGSGSTCANLEGAEDDPTGIYTPTFIGQTYEGPNSVWKSTGLTSADWTQICADDPTIHTYEDVTLDGFFIGGSVTIAEFHFPNLTDILGLSVDGQFAFADMGALTVIDAPLLATVDQSVGLGTNPLLTTVNLGSLQTITAGNLFFSGSTALVTFSLPSLVSTGADPSNTAIQGSGCTSLTTFNVPNWLPTNGTTIDLTNCALTSASVNHILARCVAAGVTTCTIALEGGTNGAPTGQGATDKADLITAGNTVTTN